MHEKDDILCELRAGSVELQCVYREPAPAKTAAGMFCDDTDRKER